MFSAGHDSLRQIGWQTRGLADNPASRAQKLRQLTAFESLPAKRRARDLVFSSIILRRDSSADARWTFHKEVTPPALGSDATDGRAETAF